MAFTIDDLSSVIAHWSADAITGLSDGDPVDALPDSISSWNLTATTTARPLYRPTSSINSLPAIEFDGSNDLMVTGSKVFSDTIELVDIFVVRIDALKNFLAFGGLNTNATPTYNFNIGYSTLGYSTGQVLSYFDTVSTGSARYQYQNSFIVSGVNAIYTRLITHNANSFKWNGLGDVPTSDIIGRDWQNNAIPAATYYANIGNYPGLANSAFDGLLAERVMLTDLYGNEHMWVEGVLAHKYGITLASWHPFYAAAPTTGPSAGGGARQVNIRGGADQ